MQQSYIETLTFEEIKHQLSMGNPQPNLSPLENGLAMLYGEKRLFGLAVTPHVPYRLPGIRIGMLVEGEAHVTLNLIPRHVFSGTLAFFCDNALLQMESMSDNCLVRGLLIEPWLLGELFPQGIPMMFNGQLKDALMPADQRTLTKVQHLYEALALVMKEKPMNRPAALAIVAALCHLYNECYVRAAEHPAEAPSRQHMVFDRFIALVNEHAHIRRDLSFYADKLCLSQRYLSRVVWQASGIYAKEWIDRAVTTEAKVMLKHSQLSVAAISEALHFPNPSFFNKFFKRQTGQTPLAFRNG